MALAFAGQAVATGGASPGDACGLFDHRHTGWTDLLGEYVRDGQVGYAEIKAEGQPVLTAYLERLQSVCPGHIAQWSRERQLAFWINAYNAYMVRLVLDHYPLKSVREIGVLPLAAFRSDFIPLGRLLGRDPLISLDVIEHEVLRRQFTEPRIHFAIVCASKGCPALASGPYRPDELDQQLDEAARRFLSDRRRNRYEPATRTLRLSSIFKWFGEDFERNGARLPEALLPYLDGEAFRAVKAGGVHIEFLEYDWSLNGR